jgi:prepilin-type N-terminal cleavage/methylation domain-containing protein
MKRGFTLTEVLVYVAVLSIIVLAVSGYLIWTIRSNTKAQVMRETQDNARRAMEIMAYEIKEAKSIYTPTSIFDSHPGQLSLETTKYLPQGETKTYIDFYLCGTRLCLKKESQDPIALTSDRVEVNNLVFSQITTGAVPSIQIDLGMNYKGPPNRPEYQASINLKLTASLRSY